MGPGRRKDQFGGVYEMPSLRWRARYCHNGRKHQKIFPTRAVAEAWLAWEASRLGILVKPRSQEAPDA